MEGFSRPTYGSPDLTVGLYRKQITVPASFAGRRIFWHCDGVYDGAELFINGRKVGYHESGFTAFDVDVTDTIVPGGAELNAFRAACTTTHQRLGPVGRPRRQYRGF